MMTNEKLEFEKFHGNGNDFIFISALYLSAFHTVFQLREFVLKVCHRNFGIGADGVVFYDDVKQELLIVNSDGSFASTCGNALRCYGLKCLRSQVWDGEKPVSIKRLVPPFLSKTTELTQNEKFVTKELEVFATLFSGNKEKQFVSVAMGVELEVRDVTSLLTSYQNGNLSRQENKVTNEFNSNGDKCVFVQLSNPHLVFISPQFSTYKQNNFSQFGIWAQSDVICQLLNCPVSNINMVSFPAQNNIWSLSVYERGAGLTLCCGSGSVASRVALEALGYVPSQEKNMSFLLEGGGVEISYGEVQGFVQRVLNGPAHFVYKGIIQ